MVSTSPAGEGLRLTTTAKFHDDGSEEWRIVIRDHKDQMVFRLAGKNTRREKSE